MDGTGTTCGFDYNQLWQTQSVYLWKDELNRRHDLAPNALFELFFSMAAEQKHVHCHWFDSSFNFSSTTFSASVEVFVKLFRVSPHTFSAFDLPVIWNRCNWTFPTKPNKTVSNFVVNCFQLFMDNWFESIDRHFFGGLVRFIGSNCHKADCEYWENKKKRSKNEIPTLKNKQIDSL